MNFTASKFEIQLYLAVHKTEAVNDAETV